MYLTGMALGSVFVFLFLDIIYKFCKSFVSDESFNPDDSICAKFFEKINMSIDNNLVLLAFAMLAILFFFIVFSFLWSLFVPTLISYGVFLLIRELTRLGKRLNKLEKSDNDKA